MQLHLVDGTYELFRSHFGAPPAKAPDGRQVGATRGMMTSIRSLLRQSDVTHVACAFDTVIRSFRNEMFEGYKTGEGIDPELHQQFELAERAMRAMGVTVWSMREFEADDGLASGAAQFGQDQRVDRVVLCSPDKDLTQCVEGTRIVCFDRRQRLLLDAEGVVHKFGVKPASIPDWLALVGDAQDGIPGIPRWGAKSTSAVLAQYEHIEAIPDAADDWAIKVRGAASLAKNLAAQRDDAELYKQLATLRRDVPIEESLDDLAWSRPDTEPLRELCAEIGFERFVRD